MPLLFVTAIALVDEAGRILLAQRPKGKDMAGLWEFPGGKVAQGETPEQALVREIKEELDLDLVASDLRPLTFASHAYNRFHLFMPLFVCRRWQGDVRPMEGQQIAWILPEAFSRYPMPPADRPLSKTLIRYLTDKANDSEPLFYTNPSMN
ncbi:MAG: (deoxy)nucleoside triphosphate pyrophosphohydrolase [Alphaproteobacteria bacterium]|nr:(deoxy)nucleoside triphosphate pyrophosphohydrolase [Alphaproteobacteria bacterium]